MIKNIIFDMGNVLLDYDPYFSLNNYVEAPGDRELIYQALFCSPDWGEADLGLIQNEDLYPLAAARLPERLHPALKQVVEHWSDCMVSLPGAREFVDDCKAAGYRVYLLSNASTLFYRYFPAGFGPLSTFDGAVISCDVHAAKPFHRIYYHLLNRYRLIPEECLMIDDRSANVEGARAVGMEAVQFQNDFQPLRELLNL